MKIHQGLPPKQDNGYVAIDLEIFNAKRAQLHRPFGNFACLSICPNGKDVYVITKASDVERAISRLGNCGIIFHNASFDIPHLRRWADIQDRTPDIFWDTLIIERILWGGYYDGFELADLARRYLYVKMDKGVRKEFYSNENPVLTSDMIQYAARDVWATWHIREKQERFLEADPQSRYIWEWIDGPAFWAIQSFKGFRLNLKKWKGLSNYFSNEAEKIRDELKFNPASSKQTLEALRKKGIHVDSSNAKIIEKYKHPLVGRILEFRTAQKLATTYGENFDEYVEDDGRIHASFSVTRALTGRSASDSPNIQNIPSRFEFRDCFEAPPGSVIIKADYAAQEPRILAYLSRDKELMNCFEKGENVHLTVARAIFNNPKMKLDKSTHEYKVGKGINLGSSYGLTPYGLSMHLDISMDEAEQYMSAYFSRFSGVQSWIARTRAEGAKAGYVRTPAGRRIWLNPYSRHSENVAINGPNQGGAADMMKRALILIYEKTGRDRYPIVAMVHDEIDVEAITKDSKKIAKLVQSCMLAAFKEIIGEIVPGEVDVTIAKSWAGRE